MHREPKKVTVKDIVSGDSKESREALDRFESELQKEMVGLRAIQERVAEELKGGEGVFVVDSTLDNITGRLLGAATERFSGHENLSRLADIVFNALYGGKIPESYKEIIAGWTGLDPERLTGIDIRQPGSSQEFGADARAVIFSGSPANISRIGQSKELRPGITHDQVYERSAGVWSEAIRQGLPAFGICYGHQMMAAYSGGTVAEVSGRAQLGPSTQEFGVGSDEFLSLLGITDNPQEFAGRISAFRVDEVTQVSDDFASLVFASTDFDSSMIYGLLHNPQGTGADPARIDQILKEGAAAGFSLQGHPELRRGYRQLIEFGVGKKLEDIVLLHEDATKETSASMLQMMSAFFTHK